MCRVWKTKYMRILLFLLVFIFLEPVSVLAAGDLVLQKNVHNMNRLKPLQNPRYIRFEKILKRKVIDSHNKVVGEVGDVLVDTRGTISSIHVGFDRLHLRQNVYLNYEALDIESVSNGYRLAFDDEQVVALYPELLANIETASGQSDVFSLSSILGKKVLDAKGRKIAKVSDILFDDTARIVKALYLDVNYKTIRNKGVAVPFSKVSLGYESGRLVVRVPQDLSEIVLNYAKG